MRDGIYFPQSLVGECIFVILGLPTLNPSRLSLHGVYCTMASLLGIGFGTWVFLTLNILSTMLLNHVFIYFGTILGQSKLGIGFSHYFPPFLFLQFHGPKLSQGILLCFMLPYFRFGSYSELAFCFIFGKAKIELCLKIMLLLFSSSILINQKCLTMFGYRLSLKKTRLLWKLIICKNC